MLFYVFSLLLAAYLLYHSVRLGFAFYRNIKLAQKSGIHYILVPVDWIARWWLITQPLWTKLLVHLPDSWTTWVDFVLPEFTYDYRHEVYARVGCDTFLTVSPTSIALFTCEPAVVSQITTRRNDFPKPIYIYRSLDIYGKNVVSTEGQHWRHHRKATSPPFTEKNNHLVWSESIKYAQAMLKSWLGPDGTAGPIVDRIMDDTMRISLYVISGAGFGRSLEWPSNKVSEDPTDHSKIQNVDDEKDPGHSMSWTYALHTLLDTILFQFLFPRSWLKIFPFKRFKQADLAYEEWGMYMKEAIDKAKQNRSQSSQNDVDILGQLVNSQMDNKGTKPLTDSEMLGNMFVLILAGHETAANAVHFSILYLALHPESQKRLQEDLDKIFGGRPPSEWDYDKDLPALFGGMAGAVMAEELRLVPAVTNIPKSTIGVSEQTLTVDGRPCTVPPNCSIALSTAAASHNPKYWPLYPPTFPGGHTAHPVANLDNDLEEFHPERWLKGASQENASEMQKETIAGGDLGVNESADTSDKLYRPVKGSYFPFSEGYRACLGRRFAQVEVLAVLAVLYQNYSIELAVDKYASDAEVLEMSTNERADVWQEAAEDARDLLLNGMGVIISLQMRKGSVPVRVVPRKQERFPANADEIWKRNHPDQMSTDGIPGWKSWKSKLSEKHKKLA